MSLQIITIDLLFITNKKSPFAQKVWIALEASGISYEMKEIDGNPPPWFLEINPDGTVPVLVCGELTLTDSEVILDFLSNYKDSKRKLYPTNESTQELVLKWRELIVNQVIPKGKKAICGRNSMTAYFTKNKFIDFMDDLDNQVIGPFLCGDDMTIADCAAFPFLWRINETVGLKNKKEEQYQRLTEWIQTCMREEAFRMTVQETWWFWW